MFGHPGGRGSRAGLEGGALLFPYRANVDLSIDDFNRIGDRIPLLANLKPHGKVRPNTFIGGGLS